MVALSTRDVTIPTPVKSSPSQDILSELGFHRAELTNTELECILDTNGWVETNSPTRQADDTSQSTLVAIKLSKVPEGQVSSPPCLPQKRYRASLDFRVNNNLITYTLYSNPLFVALPPCIGTHVLFKHQAQKYLRNVVKVPDPKSCNAMPDELLVIDAIGPGENAVARSWCSELARNAIIWRIGECCFSCATAVAATRTGLGFNVVILS